MRGVRVVNVCVVVTCLSLFAALAHIAEAGPFLPTTPSWSIEGDQEGARLGRGIGPAGDVNGDGFDDFLASAPFYDSVETDEGRVYLYLGSATGPQPSPWIGEVDVANGKLGFSVSTAGDVNGDGYDDVVVGAPTLDLTLPGRAYLYEGSAQGLSDQPVWTDTIGNPGDYFGFQVTTAGDVNGDGYDDVLVTSPYHDVGNALSVGRAMVYHGSAQGLSAAPDWFYDSDQDSEFLGIGAGHAGDVNGDGYSDIVLGGHWYGNGHTFEGRVVAFYGSPSGLPSTWDWAVESNLPEAHLGVEVKSAGDVDADGYSDIIVGGNYFGASDSVEGRAWLYRGSATGLEGTPSWRIVSGHFGDGFGFAVDSAGDVDGDGYSDFLVGAWLYDNPELDEGAAFLYSGSAGPLSTTAIWQGESDQENANMASVLAGIGDVNGDGFADVAVGSSNFDGAFVDGGKVFVYYGIPSQDDGDSDGFSPADGDCDDLDTGVFPGAIEACNGIDDNCDGAIDEDCTVADPPAPFAGETDLTTKLTFAPDSVRAADVDADGDLDLVVGGEMLRWFENLDGAGYYGPEQTIVQQAPAYFDAVVMADMDDDGDLDAVSGGTPFDIEGGTGFDANVLWWQNPGVSGDTWNPHVVGMLGDNDFPFPTPDDPRVLSVGVADVDGDGDLDIVAAGGPEPAGGGDWIAWYENDGTGSIAGEHYLLTHDPAHSVDVVDLDADGDLDIVAGMRAVLVWYENTDGTGIAFARRDIVGSGTYPLRTAWESVHAGDLNRDGRPDVVAVSSADNIIHWYDNELGDGSSFLEHEILQEAGSVPHLQLVDLDHDADDDILATYAHGLVVWIENEDGLGGSWARRVISTSAISGVESVAADIDADGDLDVVTTSKATAEPGSANSVSSQLNRSIHRNARFPAGSDLASDIDNATYKLAVGDVDGDGDPDLVAANNGQPNRLYLNNGTANPWGGVSGSDITTDADATRSVALGDVDGDGDLDLVAGNVFENRLYLNNGTSDPWGGITGSDITSARRNTTSVVLGDVDSDGDLDLVAGNWEQTNRLYLNNGTADPWNGVTGLDITTDADRTTTIALGDVDGDGDLDAVAGNWDQPNRLYLNNGTADPFDGVIGKDITADAHSTSSVALGRVDGDGDLDLVVGNWNQTNRYYPNNGSSDPWAGVEGVDTTSDAQATRWVALGDVDVDGDLDLVSGNFGPTRLYENNGTDDPWAGLNRGKNLSEGFQNTQHVVLADLDREGDLDYARASQETTVPIAVFMNRGGQYRFTHRNFAPTFAYDGETIPLLAFRATMNARSGDGVGELAALKLLIEGSGGAHIPEVVVHMLIESISIYRDTGSEDFEPTADTLITTVSPPILDVEGVLDVALPEGDPNLIIAAPADFFVVATLNPGASGVAPNDFQTTFLGEPRSRVVDAETHASLRPEPSPDFTSSAVTILPVTNADGITDEINESDGVTAFREALVEANANPGEDKITLEAQTYFLAAVGADEDGGLTGDLDVIDTTGKLLIFGAGPEQTIIDGAGLDRVFHVLPGAELEIHGVTIRGGSAGTATGAMGGAIAVESGTLTVVDSVIAGNTALDGAGAIYNEGGTVHLEGCTLTANSVSGPSGSGGAVLNTNAGQISIDGSTVSGNSANRGGAIANDQGGTLSLTLATVAGNDAVEGGGFLIDDGIVELSSCTVVDNFAATDGGGFRFGAAPGPNAELVLRNTILAANRATSGVDGSNATGGRVISGGYNLVGNGSGISFAASGPADQIGTTDSKIDPLIGPLQDNAGLSETHAIAVGSPAIDAGLCADELDQRGIERVDIPDIANPSGGNGCDIGAFELPLAEVLPRIEVPIRWCVVEGAPSFDWSSGTPQQEVNAVLRERHELTSNEIFEPRAAIRFRSAANILIPDYPILADPDTSVGEPGDVLIVPEARNYDEFLELIASCRAAWEALDPTISGITAVQINKFVDAEGFDFGLLGLGGRAEVGDAIQQLAASRIMVVDDANRQDANPADVAGRLLGHELSHSLSLPHGDGIDNPGPYEQCENGILDDEDEECEGLSQFDGTNLMQYRNDTELTAAQVGQLRYHIVTTVPDFQVDPETSSLADALSIDDERAQVLDFERAQVLDFERAQVLDFERAQVLDFETEEVLDFGFLDVVDYGMEFGATETTVYASVAGLAWPTPIRPATVYLWYLDLDNNDLTGEVPADFGYPGGLAQEAGVDLIVQVDLYSECDANNVCNDFVFEQVFVWDQTLGNYVLAYGPVQSFDFVEGVALGLVQSTVDPERDDPAVGMLIRPTFPSALIETAIPGQVFSLGDPVAMEVIAAIPCEVPLPNGVVLNCQCTNCDECQDYPGCADGEPDPASFSQCTITGGPCVTDDDCTGVDNLCSGTESLIVADEPGGLLEFEPPILPSAVAVPQVAEPGDDISIVASDFPIDTGQPMRVLLGGEVIGGSDNPTFDAGGTTTLPATIPTDAAYGDLELTVVLEGFATAAPVVVTIGAPPQVEQLSAPLEPVQETSVVTLTAEFVDNEGETHTAEWEWGDGSVTSGTVTEPTATSPGTVTDSHTYVDPGVYTATLTITDSKFNSTQQVFPFIVVYDPEGGFVTGGGWIQSPPGAYPSDPIMSGVAEFGFVSKYKKGSNVPMGETEFEFEIAGLRFHSDTYEWLVIAGAQAMFRGSGTINGYGDYGFLLTAVDERLTASTEVDLFRIKIWDKNDADAVVYDNELGDEEDARPDTMLGGGSIVIHKK